MSVSHILGNFTVVEGERTNASATGAGGRVSHVYYKTTIYAEDDTPIPAVIRAYSPASAPVLDNETVVFMFGKISPTTRGPFHIEVINIFQYPGEPSDPEHGVIPFFTPRISVLGHVNGAVETAYDGAKTFKINSTAYVRDSIHVTSFLATFTASPRWKNTPKPVSGSAIHVLGPINRIDDDSLMAVINIEDVTFNAGSRQGVASSDSMKGASTNRRFPVAGWKEGNKPKTRKGIEGTICSPGSSNTDVDIRSKQSLPSIPGDSLQEASSHSNSAHPAISNPLGLIGDSLGSGVSKFPAPSEDRQLDRPQSRASSPPVSVPTHAKPSMQACYEPIHEQRVGDDEGLPAASVQSNEPTRFPRMGWVTVNGRPATPHPYPAEYHSSVDKENENPRTEAGSDTEVDIPTSSAVPGSKDEITYPSQGISRKRVRSEHPPPAEVRKSKRIKLKGKGKETKAIPADEDNYNAPYHGTFWGKPIKNPGMHLTDPNSPPRA